MSQISSRDRRSILGTNLFYIRELTNLNPWSSSASAIKNSLTNVSIPNVDFWRLGYLSKLLMVRRNLDIDSEDYSYINDLINSLCIS